VKQTKSAQEGTRQLYNMSVPLRDQVDWTDHRKTKSKGSAEGQHFIVIDSHTRPVSLWL